MNKLFSRFTLFVFCTLFLHEPNANDITVTTRGGAELQASPLYRVKNGKITIRLRRIDKGQNAVVSYTRTAAIDGDTSISATPNVTPADGSLGGTEERPALVSGSVEGEIGYTTLKKDPTTIGVNRTAPLSVAKTSEETVTFEIVGEDTFPADSEQTITFRFTAVSTPIRNGWVSLTIPAALGSVPTKAKKTAGRVSVSGEATVNGVNKVGNNQIAISGRTINVAIGRLDIGGSVTIIYGSTADGGKKALLHHAAGDVKVTGSFKASSGVSARTAGTVTVKVGNITDGNGSAIIRTTDGITHIESGRIEAGSNHRTIQVIFIASGTMDGGAVILEIPSGWGDIQGDPIKRNYVSVDDRSNISLDIQPRSVIANITKLAKDQSFTLTLGGGTSPANNGVEVQDAIGTAQFTIKSDGDGDGVFALITSELAHKDREQIRNPDKTGRIYKDAPGIMQLKVMSALGGTGTATVDKMSVRAAEADVQLVFTYTPSQTIQDGELKFIVPSSWSQPQVEDPGTPGYTEVDGVALGTTTDDNKFSVTIPVFSLDKSNSIKIIYGAADTGRAMASTAVGEAAFKIEMKGDANGHFVPIKNQPTVTVQRQASGKGKAAIAVTGGNDSLHAGDMGREVTVTYTAAGEMVAGKVRLTIPAGWSAPTVDTVKFTPTMPPTFDGQKVMVDDLNLNAGGQVTFVYTGDVQPTARTDVKFAVAVHGGLAADFYADVSGEETKLTVDVSQARAGSGRGTVSPRIVEVGATGVNLTFTYTAVGIIDAPREFRVRVPAGWTPPNRAGSSSTDKGTYTVVHRRGGLETTASVEKLNPIGRDMIARVKLGGLEVEADDEIIFTYQNADAPLTVGVSPFELVFDGVPIADNVQVRVQDSTPSQLILESAGTVSADDGALPLVIIVGLQDAAGAAVAMESDVDVTLTSSSAGTFAMTADGTGTQDFTVTIGGGEVSTMVYYMDSTPGTAIVTATALGLTMASHPVTVTTDRVSISTASVDRTMAKMGDTVTITATGTAGQTATYSIGSVIPSASLTESPVGTYTGTYTPIADLHDGTHTVTVSLNGVSRAAGTLTVDTTAPAVTASAAPATVMNGDTVTITATVSDTLSGVATVTVNVAALDSAQTGAVTFVDADGDGNYSASITISADNAAENGFKSITVIATDAAGNSGPGTAMVMLDNTLTYTSMIPAGTSLFHVPLDVEGLDTVGDLKTMLSDAALLIVYDSATGVWNSHSDDVMITADLGIIVLMRAAATVTFTGDAWDRGKSAINLKAGANLIGLPVNDPRVTNVSDIMGLFASGVVSSITVSTDDGFASFAAAGDAGDGPIVGDVAYLVIATADATAAVIGTGWSNDATGAAPIGLLSHRVEGQTPVLDVKGSVVNQITGLVQEDFRVRVNNLSTQASLNSVSIPMKSGKVTSADPADSSRLMPCSVNSYNITFVDLKAGHAARVGDILEISADSPNPLIGVQPIRHIVTVDDVKESRIELEPLIAYEIPAETELLQNYPNPFNPETWIPYRLAEDADVSLAIYDVNGELVRSIHVGHQTAAGYESRAKAIYWDGRNRLGEQVASGVYFYSLSAGGFSATRKMIILK